MRSFYLLSAVAIVTLVLYGCSETKEGGVGTAPVISVHGTGFADTSSSAFHAVVLRKQNFDIRPCRKCHASNYSGGIAQTTCLDCHSKVGGPENCTTCHGSVNAAPPQDLAGDTLRAKRSIAAHQPHLIAGKMSSPVRCQACHMVPTTVYEYGHITDSTAGVEVRLTNDPLSKLTTGGGTYVIAPSFDSATAKCNSTFCHGNWKSRKIDADPGVAYIFTDSMMVGENYSPVWTAGSAQAGCGTCHGLPPKGHLQPLALSACGNSGCHPGIVDASGKIVDRTKHMNGKINARNSERNF